VSPWLDPLRRALDEAERPPPFFFRDDDAPWGEDRLWVLLDLFAVAGLPLDLAVIPGALTTASARRLRRRIAGSDGRLAAHQHGYSHQNHEPEGRKNEFGPARDEAAQLTDIATGQGLLATALGPTAPVFTPPWNRCTAATGRSAARLGFQVLSRDHTAGLLQLDGLAELPVRIDWFARRKGVRLDRDRLGALIGAAVAHGSEPVGVMLHHAVTDDHQMAAIGELLAVVAAHPRAVARPMLSLAAIPPAGTASAGTGATAG
jgi:hypothetical protein